MKSYNQQIIGGDFLYPIFVKYQNRNETIKLIDYMIDFFYKNKEASLKNFDVKNIKKEKED